MYIRVGAYDYFTGTFFYHHYMIFAENHKRICASCTSWPCKANAIRAAKKMAEKLNIEYREVK